MVRRSGGRSARVHCAMRLWRKSCVRFVAVMLGGQYKPLNESDIASIHASALQVLEEIGLADAPQSGVEVMVAAGAIYGDDKRLRFPTSHGRRNAGKSRPRNYLARA